MNAAFLIVLTIYMVHAIFLNRRSDPQAPGKSSRLGLMIQVPLLAFGVYYGMKHGIFSRDLISPISIGAGLIAGHLIFGISLLLIHRVVRDAAEHFLDLSSLWDFLVENPALLMRFLFVSFTEEIVYRVTAQSILIDWYQSPVLPIFLVAVAFSVVHHHFFRNSWIQSAEFLAFALLLGALYYASGSVMLVVVIHTLRNLESVYLEYLVKAEELGDETRALEAIEKLYMHRPSEMI